MIIDIFSEFVRSEMFGGLQAIVIMVLACERVILRSRLKEHEELLSRSLAHNKRLAQDLRIKCSNKNQDA